MFIKYLSAILLIGLIISCAGPMDQTESDDAIQLLTIKNGSILETGSALPLTLVYNESQYGFDYVKIVLFNDEGTEIAEDKIEKSYVSSNRKKEVFFPEDLENGIYHVKFVLYNDEKIIFSTVTHFFSEKKSYRINNIQSYPPNPVPGEKVIFFADFAANASADPYFRWIIGKNIVSEGYYSKGANKYIWTIPAAEGAYSVTVELFPFKPLDKVFAKFNSAISKTSSVIVSESNRVKSTEFLPEASYSTLYHFRGDIVDSGYLAAANGVIEIAGEPSLDFKGGVYGYYFKENEYIEIPNIVIPFLKEGALQPFSIKLKFIDDFSISPDVTESSPFFNSWTEDENFKISLGQDSMTQYFCEIVSGTNKFVSKVSLNLNTLNTILNLTVSFYPGSNSCTIVWIMNGETIGREEIPFLPSLVERNGKTVIGGGLCPMLFDEAGIYTRTIDGKNSAAPFCFRDHNAEIFGKSLLLAEGFEYMEKLSPLKNDGVVVNNGMAVLNPAGWICAGSKIQLSGNAEVNIAVVEGACVFVIRDSSGADIFSRSIKEGSENFIINNITSGDYDIYILNDKEIQTTSVDSVLITKAVN